MLLMFCFAEADGGPEVARFKHQYMFEESEIARRQALMAEGSDSGFIEWCSGRPTGKALAHIAMTDQLKPVSCLIPRLGAELPRFPRVRYRSFEERIVIPAGQY